MPRARVPSASLKASADALILPWLAPRAFAESPVLRRQRRDGKGVSTLKEQEAAEHARSIAHVDDGLAECCSTRPHQSLLISRISPRASRSLAQRYVDIASFTHRHVRSYATSAVGADHAPPETPQSIASDVSNGTRYSRRRSWKTQLERQDGATAPKNHARRRAELIAQAETRLARHAERLQRDRGRYQNKLLYDGQYRSLRRLILSLKRWDATVEDTRKDTSSESEDEQWLLNTFAALDRSVYPRLHALTKPITLQHAPECREHALRLLENVDTDGGSRIYFNWHAYKDQQNLYEGTLVYLLDNTPGYAQDLITVLATDEQLPRSAPLLADALAYLARLHVKGEYADGQGWEESAEANTRKFVATFLNCTRFLDTSVYSQDLLHSLVLLADIEDLKKIYTALVESKTRLSLGTLLHYASAFGEAGEFNYALQCLQRRLANTPDATREGIVNTDVFRWTCAAILRGSMRKAGNYHETPAIVAAFVELGVKMDLLLYDVVMHNAMDAGDFATAFKVFNALESNGLKPDKYTLSILLHGCATQQDPAMFKAFAEFSCKKAKELEDPWLATDYIYYTYACEQNKDATSRNANATWQAYLDLFELAPLQPFIRDGSRAMKDAIDQEGPNIEKKSLAPEPATLYLMLQTEILTFENLGIHYLERLYKTFTHALSSPKAHPTLLSLAQTPIIWNAFLHAFCKRKQYASASSVIKEMATHSTPPNIYSWNIFMQAFFKSGQVTAADRVFALMRHHDINPDTFTYGIMVRGYAKAQLISRIGETMQHIPEHAQLEPDLLRLLGQVQKRADLTATLERNRLEKMRREAEERERRVREEGEEGKRYRSLFARAVEFRETRHWDHGTLEEARDYLEPEEEEDDNEIDDGEGGDVEVEVEGGESRPSGSEVAGEKHTSEQLPNLGAKG